MRNLLSYVVLVSALVAGSLVHAQEKSYQITGTVSTVGSNLGTSVEGLSFGADADTFKISLTFDSGQTPHVVAGMAFYRLWETSITIYADGGPLTWSFSTPLADNGSHDFSIQNNVGNPAYDNFTAGGSPGTFSGPALNGKNFSYWMMTLSDFQGTILSDTSLPETLTMAALEQRSLSLIFDGFMAGDYINLAPQQVELVSASAIPEPSTWAAIAGGLALGAAGWAKRRKR